ncbi:MAG: hypothetical protein K2G89_04615 [Lachnospiraceae bacterium]|nr:hypothetical protein [Lachnospiraceae bacterium]
MKRYTFSIVIAVLLIMAVWLCLLLFQKDIGDRGDSILIRACRECTYGR